MANGEEAPAGIDFLDFVFTISVGVGLTPEVLNLEVGGQKITGLLSEQWIKDGSVPGREQFLQLCTFFLGFLTLTLSWFGYHASIKRRPLRYESPWGMARFVLDVLLVLLYGVILLQYKNLRLVLFLLAISYGLFVIWDVFKVIEHWGSYKVLKPWAVRFRRELVSLFWAVMFWILWGFHEQLPSGILIIFAVGFTILYRVNKYIRLWEFIFGIAHE